MRRPLLIVLSTLAIAILLVGCSAKTKEATAVEAASETPEPEAVRTPSGDAVGVASVFGGVRVVPGDPEASVLFAKVKGEPLPPNLGRPMPLHLERLTPEERQTLRDWISEGAKNN